MPTPQPGIFAQGTRVHRLYEFDVRPGVDAAHVRDALVGLRQTSVTAGGPAEQAGIQAGDLITTIDGAPATSAEQLLEVTLTKRPGDTVALTYQRGGTDHDTTVTLGAR